jgi:hypothetical protein
MTNHVGRLYSLALALLVFFVLWAGIAARPWASATADPRLTALAAREQQLRHDSALVTKIVNARWGVYKTQLAQRKVSIAAARQRQAAAVTSAAVTSAAAPVVAASAPVSSASPVVRIVNLPPLTITRTS